MDGKEESKSTDAERSLALSNPTWSTARMRASMSVPNPLRSSFQSAMTGTEKVVSELQKLTKVPVVGLNRVAKLLFWLNLLFTLLAVVFVLYHLVDLEVDKNFPVKCVLTVVPGVEFLVFLALFKHAPLQMRLEALGPCGTFLDKICGACWFQAFIYQSYKKFVYWRWIYSLIWLCNEIAIALTFIDFDWGLSYLDKSDDALTYTQKVVAVGSACLDTAVLWTAWYYAPQYFVVTAIIDFAEHGEKEKAKEVKLDEIVILKQRVKNVKYSYGDNDLSPTEKKKEFAKEVIERITSVHEENCFYSDEINKSGGIFPNLKSPIDLSLSANRGNIKELLQCEPRKAWNPGFKFDYGEDKESLVAMFVKNIEEDRNGVTYINVDFNVNNNDGSKSCCSNHTPTVKFKKIVGGKPCGKDCYDQMRVEFSDTDYQEQKKESEREKKVKDYEQKKQNELEEGLRAVTHKLDKLEAQGENTQKLIRDQKKLLKEFMSGQEKTFEKMQNMMINFGLADFPQKVLLLPAAPENWKEKGKEAFGFMKFHLHILDETKYMLNQKREEDRFETVDVTLPSDKLRCKLLKLLPIIKASMYLIGPTMKVFTGLSIAEEAMDAVDSFKDLVQHVGSIPGLEDIAQNYDECVKEIGKIAGDAEIDVEKWKKEFQENSPEFDSSDIADEVLPEHVHDAMAAETIPVSKKISSKGLELSYQDLKGLLKDKQWRDKFVRMTKDTYVYWVLKKSYNVYKRQFEEEGYTSMDASTRASVPDCGTDNDIVTRPATGTVNDNARDNDSAKDSGKKSENPRKEGFLHVKRKRWLVKREKYEYVVVEDGMIEICKGPYFRPGEKFPLAGGFSFAGKKKSRDGTGKLSVSVGKIGQTPEDCMKDDNLTLRQRKNPSMDSYRDWKRVLLANITSNMRATK